MNERRSFLLRVRPGALRPPGERVRCAEAHSPTQLYYAARNGVRFSGMPAWGSDSAEDDWANWKLVHFIRHLPKITKAELREMKRLNPKSPEELEEDAEAEKFLKEGGSTKPSDHHH